MHQLRTNVLKMQKSDSKSQVMTMFDILSQLCTVGATNVELISEKNFTSSRA